MDKITAYGFGSTWGQENNDRIFLSELVPVSFLCHKRAVHHMLLQQLHLNSSISNLLVYNVCRNEKFRPSVTQQTRSAGILMICLWFFAFENTTTQEADFRQHYRAISICEPIVPNHPKKIVISLTGACIQKPLFAKTDRTNRDTADSV